MKNLLRALPALVAALMLGVAPAALADGSDDGHNGNGNGNGNGGNGKTTICHATGSETNPYVEITVSNSALAAHVRHQDGRDIIPAPAGGCPTGDEDGDCDKGDDCDNGDHCKKGDDSTKGDHCKKGRGGKNKHRGGKKHACGKKHDGKTDDGGKKDDD
jgi:hypothetical protein